MLFCALHFIAPVALLTLLSSRTHFVLRIKGEGTLDAETIDKELLIDTHYGAIASKAVKLSPKVCSEPTLHARATCLSML
jgi:hypothetical protein